MRQIHDGEECKVHIPNENTQAYRLIECCDCGLQHHLYIGRTGKDVTLAFVRVAKGKKKQKK